MEKIKEQYLLYIELAIAIVFIGVLPFFAIFYLGAMSLFYKLKKGSDAKLVFYVLFFVVSILQTMNYFNRTGMLF